MEMVFSVQCNTLLIQIKRLFYQARIGPRLLVSCISKSQTHQSAAVTSNWQSDTESELVCGSVDFIPAPARNSRTSINFLFFIINLSFGKPASYGVQIFLQLRG